MVAGVVPAGVVGTEHLSSPQGGPGERERERKWEGNMGEGDRVGERRGEGEIKAGNQVFKPVSTVWAEQVGVGA